ncbi:MAG TPA: hypothetical protein VFO62_10745 [Candidatus Binatia bacterium]|nr:hypothetical protein [Candidatus Binatia bacterium]
MTIVFRVQDHEGRGPFRPGLPRMWSDPGAPLEMLPTWMEEFGDDIFEREGRAGEVFGSAVLRLEDIGRWFTSSEQGRLARLGFRVVSIPDARVIAASESQVVFGRRRPLAEGVQVRRWP